MTSPRGGLLRRIAAPLGLAVLVLASAPAAGAAESQTSAASTICVGVVIDYEGQRTQYGSGANTFCAQVPAGSTGTAVLDARARALGRPAPTFQSNGLLCQIDGFPSTHVCNTVGSNGGFDYWSYWNRPAGAASWTYAREGPSYYAPGNGAEEGWTWVEGQSEADAPRPPLLSPASICPTITASPTPSATPSTPGGTVTSAPTTTGGSPGPTHVSATVPGTSPAPGGEPTPTPDGRSPTTEPTSTDTSASDATGSPSSAPTSSAARTSSSRSASGAAGRVSPSSLTSSPPTAVTHLVAAATAPGVGTSPAATAWIAGLVLITCIGGAAWWRSRSP